MPFPFPVGRLSSRVAQIVTLIGLLLVLVLLGVLWYANTELARVQQRLHPQIVRALRETLGRDVRIGAVQVRGLDQIVLTNAVIARGSTFAGGTVLTAPRATAHVNLFSFLFRHRNDPVAAIRQITLTRPRAEVSRAHDGRWDFQDIVDRLTKRPAGAGNLRAQLVIDQGQVAVQDVAGSIERRNLVGVNARVSAGSQHKYAFYVAAADARQLTNEVHVAGVYSPNAGVARLNVHADRIAVQEITRFLPANLPITFADGTAALRIVALFKSLPAPQRATLSATELTAEIDLAGVGLRLREMNTPIMATAGRLRLVHNAARYPRGSRLELLGVHARANQVPLELSGIVSDLNLFDLRHSHPRLQLALATSVADGAQLLRLFPHAEWLRSLQLVGRTRLTARVDGPLADPRIDGTIRGDTLALRELHTDDVRADFTVRPYAAQSPTVQVTAHARRAALGETVYDDVQLTFASLTPWRRFWQAPTATGTASAARIRLPGVTVEHVTASVGITRDAISFRNLRAGVFGGEVRGAVHVPLHTVDAQTHPALSADGAYRDVDLRALGEALNIHALSGRGQGSLDVGLDEHGNLRVTATVNAARVAYRQYAAETLQARLRIDSGAEGTAVSIASASARTRYGLFTVQDGRYMQGILHLPLHGEQLALRQFGYQDLRGTGTLDGVLSGKPAAPRLSAQVTAVDGALLGRTYATAQGALEWQGSTLLLRDVAFARPGMTLRIDDRGAGFDPRRGMRGTHATLLLHGATVHEVLALFGTKSPWDIAGAAEGTISLDFNENGLSLAGNAVIPAAVVRVPAGEADYPLRLDSLGMTFDLADRTLQVRDLALIRKDAVIHAHGMATATDDGVRAELAFSGNHAPLEDLPLDLLGIPIELAGAVDINGTLRGPLSGNGTEPLAVAVSASAPRLIALGLPVGAGTVALEYRVQAGNRELVIRHGELTHPALHAVTDGRYRLSAGTMDGVTVKLDRLNLGALASLLAQEGDGPRVALPPGLAGHGEAEIIAAGRMAQPTVTLSFGLRQLALGQTTLPNLRARLTAAANDGRYRVHIDDAVAEDAAGTRLAGIRGDLDPRNGPDLQISVQRLTARTLTPWFGTLPVDGALDLAATLRGPWAQPVLDGDVQITRPMLAGQTLSRLRGHLRVSADRVTISDGLVWFAADAPPAQVSGSVPLAWHGWHARIPRDRSLAFALDLPQQDLAAVRPLLPFRADLTGVVEGGLTVGGTLAAPRLSRGWVALEGAGGLPVGNSTLPNRLEELKLRAAISGDLARSQLKLTAFSARLDRLVNGKRPRGFQPGWLSATGTVGIPTRELAQPQRWQWDLVADLNRLPLDPALFLVPRASGYLHLVSARHAPRLEGVLLVENARLKEPKMRGGAARWPSFLINPTLSLVIQVGTQVKMSKGMFSVPLRPTPLPKLTVAEGPTTPVADGAAYRYHSEMLHPGTNEETTGTWGVVTGLLNDPRLYARFEVDKGRLSFPLNLIGSVRRAKGRVTYSLADGPRIVMGLPDFPSQSAKTPATETPATITAPALGLR